MLVNYHDNDIVDMLHFGFPVERSSDVPLEMGRLNHKGATSFPEHIDSYITKEMELGAVMGPFEAIPFKNSPVAISPLSTREKKDWQQKGDNGL